MTGHVERGPMMLAPPRDSSRRSRIEDLEDMMMMEAIRLSLASEEERKKKEDKEAKREAKKKEKRSRRRKRLQRKPPCIQTVRIRAAQV
jgi:protein subunit release factor B